MLSQVKLHGLRRSTRFMLPLPDRCNTYQKLLSNITWTSFLTVDFVPIIDLILCNLIE